MIIALRLVPVSLDVLAPVLAIVGDARVGARLVARDFVHGAPERVPDVFRPLGVALALRVERVAPPLRLLVARTVVRGEWASRSIVNRTTALWSTWMVSSLILAGPGILPIFV